MKKVPLYRRTRRDSALSTQYSALGPRLLAVALTLSLIIPTAGTAVAATSPVATFDISQATSQFPSHLTFSTTVNTTSTLREVDFDYRLANDPVVSVGPATFKPGAPGQATFTLDLSQAYVPPGVTVHYQWVAQGQSGPVGKSQWADLIVADPRFWWHELSGQDVTVHWYAGPDNFGQTMLQGAEAGLAQGIKATGGQISHPINVYLYETEADFRGALNAGSASWVGGETFGNLDTVIILAPSNDPTNDDRSLRHEMTHVVLDDTRSSPFGHLPSWLDEGLAEVSSGPLDPAMTQKLSDAVSKGQVNTIRAISGSFPPSTSGAELAYAESDRLVRFISQKYGWAKLQALVAAFRNGQTSAEAFQSALSTSEATVQEQWWASLGVGPTTSAPTNGGLDPAGAISAATRAAISVIRGALGLLRPGG